MDVTPPLLIDIKWGNVTFNFKHPNGLVKSEIQFSLADLKCTPDALELVALIDCTAYFYPSLY